VATVDDSRREELAAFLRARRARVDRAALGLPDAPRARVSGLRREEVAALAGVSVTWYTWLEQARPINPSPQVLEAIGRLFSLSGAELSYLLTLGGHPQTAAEGAEAAELPAHLQRFIEAFDHPAFLLAPDWSIVAWNRAYRELYPRIDALGDDERNLLWLLFTDASLRELLPDWQVQSRRFAGEFRAQAGPRIGAPATARLVRRLRESSPEFARVWQEQDVETFTSREREFVHPVRGRVVYEEHRLMPADAPGLQLVFYLGVRRDGR